MKNNYNNNDTQGKIMRITVRSSAEPKRKLLDTSTESRERRWVWWRGFLIPPKKKKVLLEGFYDHLAKEHQVAIWFFTAHINKDMDCKATNRNLVLSSRL